MVGPSGGLGVAESDAAIDFALSKSRPCTLNVAYLRVQSSRAPGVDFVAEPSRRFRL